MVEFYEARVEKAGRNRVRPVPSPDSAYCFPDVDGLVVTSHGARFDAWLAEALEHARTCRATVDSSPRRVWRALAGDAQPWDEMAAAERVRRHLPELAAYDVYDLTAHECAARVFRLSGDLAAAREQLTQGLARSEPFPEIHGLMLEELARLERAGRDEEAAAAALSRASAAFERGGLTERAGSLLVSEFGAAWAAGPTKP
jgi:hypothetical protein